MHKICKFENHVARNEVIRMSLQKTIVKQWKNTDLQGTKQNTVQKVLIRAIHKFSFY